MKFSLVELDEFPNYKIKVYSILIGREVSTLYDKFLEENYKKFSTEIEDINNRIEIIAAHTGLRDDFIKPNEGIPGDGVCALYDKPGSKLRLYFIRYGNVAVILGGGGEKPKHIKALKEDPKLKEQNYLLRKISIILKEAMQDGTLKITNEGFESTTDFTYSINDDE